MFTNCTFDGTSVDLHAGPYTGCLFRHCELVFDGRPVHLDSNTFSGCHWTFTGAAGATMALLEMLCRNDPNVAREIGLRLGFVNEHTH
jgi:hypothetical protein